MGKKPVKATPAAGGKPRTQYGALPWRPGPDGSLEVLLISSRDTHRWVIPKGWPIKRLEPAASAAREAFEEAGVVGQTQAKPLGVFFYEKRMRSGRERRVRVRVYSLEVTEERPDWPEKGEREKLWIGAVDAAAAVAEPELSSLIAAFARTG